MGDPHADHERVVLLALLDERPLLPDGHRRPSWPDIASEVALRGSAVSLWNEVHPPTLAGMEDATGVLTRARERLQTWRAADFQLVTVLDGEYPLALRMIHQMPPLLFVKGKLLAEEVGVSIIGTREATGKGLSIAAAIATGLAQRGVSVISALATGIDTAAHWAALQVGGRPIGVLGTGINKVYPMTASSRDLHDRVAAAGALVSQFLPDAPPTKQTFPMRNVTMSGLGHASVIVEAGEHSGTRVLARAAVEHGRPVILTDVVVQATAWGKAMQDRPGVYVGGSTAEVVSIVEALIAARDEQIAVVLSMRAARLSDSQ